MQKLFNFMALAAFGFTIAQLIVLADVFTNKDKYLNQVKETIIEEVTEVIPSLIQSSVPSVPDTGGLNVGPNF